ncbi:MAG: hypothetical protein QNJ68_12015 [Microcoleaceae cyanobacterium MO_207.B10]|nr:hypothetical protein [Microcoleaceae cyanobacterium MO_207.B10]
MSKKHYYIQESAVGAIRESSLLKRRGCFTQAFPGCASAKCGIRQVGQANVI